LRLRFVPDFFKAAKINFFLPQDDALEAWRINNNGYKPQKFMVNIYAYLSQNPPGEKLTYGPVGGLFTRSVTQLPEAMGYVTKSRSNAAGTRACTTNTCITSAVDMGENGIGFGNEHSAQWVYSIKKTILFGWSL
jgi:hypothetical protein